MDTGEPAAALETLGCGLFGPKVGLDVSVGPCRRLLWGQERVLCIRKSGGRHGQTIVGLLRLSPGCDTLLANVSSVFGAHTIRQGSLALVTLLTESGAERSMRVAESVCRSFGRTSCSWCSWCRAWRQRLHASEGQGRQFSNCRQGLFGGQILQVW